MREAYQITKEELLSGIDTKTGLTTKQALTKLEKDGENVLEETKRKSVWSVFIGQFADLLVVILIVAAVISMVSGNVESTIVIFAVIILNSILGTVQYVKAEKSLESLKALSSPHVKVLRDGVKQEIESKSVVRGDLVLLEAGDMIVADGRIINNYSLQVNESSLTGESLNVDKKDIEIGEDMPLGDRVNMVAANCFFQNEMEKSHIYAGSGAFNCHQSMEGDIITDTTGYIAIGEMPSYDKTEKCKGCGKCTRNCSAGVIVHKLIKCVDENKVKMMESGKSPIYEPGLEELMVKNMDHLYFTTDYKKAYVDADVVNCEISNCASYCVYVAGGKHNFVHNTIAAYYGYPYTNLNIHNNILADDVAAVYINNLSKNNAKTNSSFSNCIITGGRKNNLVVATPLSDYYEGRFEGNYLRTDSLDEVYAKNNVYASDSDSCVFRNIYYLYKEYHYYDFRLDSLSPARGIGDSIVALSFPQDRAGNRRKQYPDAGCYEYIEE